MICFRVMLDKEQKIEAAIGLVILVCSAGGGHILDDYNEPSARFGKVLMASASALLVFGAVAAKKDHRIKIQIFWLLSSVVFLATTINLVNNQFYRSYIPYLIVPLACAGILHIGLMLWIYGINVRLTKVEEHSEDVTSVKPPPYNERETPKAAESLKVEMV